MASDQRSAEERPRPPAHGKPGFKACLAVLLACCAFFFFYGLTANDLYKTEGHRAQPPVEMLERGSWVVPYMYGRPYLAKPPVIYVCIMAVTKLSGGEVTVLTARLPSAIAATLSVLIVFLALSRWFDPRAGLIGALMLTMSLPWFDKSVSADIEMLLIALVTGSIFSLYRAVSAEGTWESVFWWLVTYLFVALGFLTKGPPAVIFFLCALIPFVVRHRRPRLLVRWPHMAGVGLCVLLIGLWLWLVVRAVGWEALLASSGGQTKSRFVLRWPDYPVELLAHPFKIFAALLPWSLVALPACLRGVRMRFDEEGRRFVRFLLDFLLVSIVFWSLLPVHPVRYSYPMLPALGALAASVWHLWLTEAARPRRDRLARLMRWFNMLAFVAATLGLMFGGVRVIGTIGRYVPVMLGCCAVGFAAAIVGFIWSVGDRRRLVIWAWLVIWIGLKVFFVEVYLAERKLRKTAAPAGRAIGGCVPEGEVLHIFANWEPALMFYADVEILRYAEPDALPRRDGEFWVLLTQDGYAEAAPREDLAVDLVRVFRDNEGRPIVLARLRRRGSPPAGDQHAD